MNETLLKLIAVVLILLLGLGFLLWPRRSKKKKKGGGDDFAPQLMEAVRKKDAKLVRQLLRQGADPNSEDKDGWSPLMWAVHNGSFDMVDALLIHGADVNHQDLRGKTCAMLAAKFGFGKIMTRLVEKGADPNAADEKGRTPLMYAVEENDPKLVSSLMIAGADPNTTDHKGRSAFDTAQARAGRFPDVLLSLEEPDSFKQKKKSKAPKKKRDMGMMIPLLLLLILLPALAWMLYTQLGSELTEFSLFDEEDARDEVLVDNPMESLVGGDYPIGCAGDDRLCGDNEEPRVTVKLSPFYISKYEVSFAEYEMFLDDQTALNDGRKRPRDEGWGGGSRPVINVSWYDAIAYCNWLSMKEGLAPVYSVNGDPVIPKEGSSDIRVNHKADGYRLPTEAEWERAARGDDMAAIWPWGAENPISARPPRAAFRGEVQTRPVGSYVPNALNLYDLAGNVAEWTTDTYSSQYHRQVEGEEDPVYLRRSSKRTVRGGHWKSRAGELRCSAREGVPASTRASTIGFRICRSAGR